jgi:hypothetical protein
MLYLQPLRRDLPGEVPLDEQPLFFSGDGEQRGHLQKAY